MLCKLRPPPPRCIETHGLVNTEGDGGGGGRWWRWTEMVAMEVSAERGRENEGLEREGLPTRNAGV